MSPLSAISLVVPTRNRAYTLRVVAPGWYEQAGIDEIIIVDDAGSDDTPALVASLAAKYPHVRTSLLRNPVRAGASESRNRGAAAAKNEFVLFCDDDMHLERNYAQTCLRKLLEREAGAVSGRLVYLYPAESPEEALKRFGSGTRAVEMFRRLTCLVVHEASSPGDVEQPLTNPVILTRKELLKRFGFDRYYARGNGYREESDFQMNLFVNGFPIIVTNECHSFHVNNVQVKTGGQRVDRWQKAFWTIFYTNYFFGKYWSRYAPRVGLKVSRYPAVAAFAAYYIYSTFVRGTMVRFGFGRAMLGMAQEKLLRRA
jgi:glycosyltransferase involved in cell wall biosynthesis